MNALSPCPPFPPFPPFPANPAVGDRFGSWVWNGSSWVVSPPSGLVVNVQTFTANGTYLPSPNLAYLTAELVGGGGGGGPATADLTSTSTQGWMMGGGGGSSGGYSRKTVPGALVLGGVAVAVGAGGAGGSAGVAGSVGGATSFGAFAMANGGLGGGSGNPGDQFGDGGPRAQPGTGDIAAAGNAGSTGIGYYYDTSAIAGTAVGGQGGASFFNGADRNVSATAGVMNNGLPGWMGAGGGGGASGLSTLPAVGGAGGGGLVIVTEYCTVPSGSGSGACASPMARIADCGEGWNDGSGAWPPPGGWGPVR